MDYVVSAANLQASIYGLPQVRDKAAIAAMVVTVNVPQFVPRSGVRIAMTDSEAMSARDDDSDGKASKVSYFDNCILCNFCNAKNYQFCIYKCVTIYI